MVQNWQPHAVLTIVLTHAVLMMGLIASYKHTVARSNRHYAREDLAAVRLYYLNRTQAAVVALILFSTTTLLYSTFVYKVNI